MEWGEGAVLICLTNTKHLLPDALQLTPLISTATPPPCFTAEFTEAQLTQLGSGGRGSTQAVCLPAVLGVGISPSAPHYNGGEGAVNHGHLMMIQAAEL